MTTRLAECTARVIQKEAALRMSVDHPSMLPDFDHELHVPLDGTVEA